MLDRGYAGCGLLRVLYFFQATRRMKVIREGRGVNEWRSGSLSPSNLANVNLPVPHSKRTSRAPSPNTAWKRSLTCFCNLGVASSYRTA
jgi:hypothetical protein